MILNRKNNILANDVLIPFEKIPVVSKENILREAIQKMSEFKLGVCCCVDKKKN